MVVPGRSPEQVPEEAEGEMTTAELRREIEHALRAKGPSGSDSIREAIPGRPSKRRVQETLWEMNSQGEVSVTPDSRWDLVRKPSEL